jgi:hypothetical protein
MVGLFIPGYGCGKNSGRFDCADVERYYRRLARPMGNQQDECPGLYGVGNPGETSPVFVTANYKLTFDKLRKGLGGIDGWIIVLDTKGINVWCAAGKGTFGTEELIRKIFSTNIGAVVSHRRLILPQLGAAGVSGFAVTKAAGFSVLFGPVRVKDIKEYLSGGCVKTERMRTVYFPISERMAVAPIELVFSMKYLLLYSSCQECSASSSTGFLPLMSSADLFRSRERLCPARLFSPRCFRIFRSDRSR